MFTLNSLKRKILDLDVIVTPLLLIVLPFSILNGILEYLEGGKTLYVYRDVINVVLLILGYFLYKLKFIEKISLFVIAIYAIVIAITYNFIIGFYDPDFNFYNDFLQSEILITLLIFALGLLTHFKHILILLVYNLFFILTCYFAFSDQLIVGRFIYYFGLVNGAGIMAYASQRSFTLLTTQLRTANTLVTKRNKELKAINDSKNQLFRIIGHDLRTPFFQIEALLELLDDANTDQEINDIKRLLKEASRQGNGLLEDILGWNKMYDGKVEISLTKQQLLPIIENVFNFLRFKASMKDVSLKHTITTEEFTINGVLMETVLRNLVANAIKFSHRGSEILITFKKESDHNFISIIDHGVGMDKEQLKNLFKHDINVSKTGTEEEVGTGHGLMIAKKLVEKQNAKLLIDSELNKGTVISVAFKKKDRKSFKLVG